MYPIISKYRNTKLHLKPKKMILEMKFWILISPHENPMWLTLAIQLVIAEFKI